jgi:hypothetical protein
MKRASSDRNAEGNRAVLRHINVNVLRKARSSRVGIYAKRLKAGWANHYFLQVLDGVMRVNCPEDGKQVLAQEKTLLYNNFVCIWQFTSLVKAGVGSSKGRIVGSNPTL